MKEPVVWQQPTRRSWLKMTKARLGFLLFLPSLIALIVIIFKPLFDSLVMSFHKLDFLFGTGEPFVGFKNYIWLLKSDWFLPTLWQTILVTGVVMSAQIVLSLAIALLTDFDYPGKGLIRSILVAPWAIPIVVAALMWSWIYEPTIGPVNHIFLSLGIIKEPVVWLSNRKTALAAVMLALIWKGLPFMYIAMLAGLQQISHEQKEAARVDGANVWQEFWHVVLPGMRYILTIMIILRTIFLFNHFAYIYLLTGGGPLGATEVLAISAVRMGVNSFRYGRAATVTTVMFFVLVTLFAVYYTIDKEQRSTESR